VRAGLGLHRVVEGFARRRVAGADERFDFAEAEFGLGRGGADHGGEERRRRGEDRE